MNLDTTQSFMRQQGLAGWLLYDFRGSNPVLARLLGGKRWTTRRAVLFIPAEGVPRLLVHGIDASQFGQVALGQVEIQPEQYLTWQQFRAWIEQIAGGQSGGARRIAMEYSAGGMLPAVSITDAGTVDLVRGAGAEVISSADVMQVAAAIWSDQARRNHEHASARVAAVKDSAFALIRDQLAAGRSVTEVQVARHIREGFAREQLETLEGPVVAVNAHSGDPHYEPVEATDAPIRRGDWILIDLWARVPGEENIFSDITWVAFAGATVPPKHLEVFHTVKQARDAALARAVEGWKNTGGGGVQGWQLDDAARHIIESAGFAQFIRHRTGHSLSPGPVVHGLGMNLDNLETHDTRRMLPGAGFTIEPGIYTPEFGVRLEINVFVDPQRGPVVTSDVQEEVVLV